MSEEPRRSANTECVTALARGIRMLAPRANEIDQAGIAALCFDAVALATSESDDVAAVCRRATQLLVSTDFPQLNRRQVRAIAALSAGVALRFQSSLRPSHTNDATW